MPKIQITNAKGLVQKSGKGHEHTSAGGVGFHRWVEEITLGTGAVDDVVGRVGMYIPAQARIMMAHIIVTALSSAEADASVCLNVHSADIAVDAEHDGTEIVGADVAGNVSTPNLDLVVGSGDVLNANVSMGTLVPVVRGTDASYFSLVAQETMTVEGGYTPQDAKVVVIIEWFGPAAIALA